MNIFYVHESPYRSATMLCDKHVVKMILESAQMLSTAHRVLDGDEIADSKDLYKAVHKNHPCTIWTCSSSAHYEWLYEHMSCLMTEYQRRYEKTHATHRLHFPLCNFPHNIEHDEFSPPPQCMPDQYKVEGNTVQSYRNYYHGEKAYFAKWNNGRQAPTWWSENENTNAA